MDEIDGEKTSTYPELKQKMPPGPWQDEPDRVEFKHAGMSCLMNRSHFGVWCGYVAMPPGHPWFEKHYNEIYANVHGGLTYSRECQGEICHVASETDHVWWLGFDCGHGGDGVPNSHEFRSAVLSNPLSFFDENRDDTGEGTEHEPYRTLAYARAETERLAEQAEKMVLRNP